MYTNKVFFQSLFAFWLCFFLSSASAATFSLVSSFSFFAFFRSGLLCTAELLFLDQISGPCSHFVGMCPCKARRFVEALRFSWIFNFALFSASALFFGLDCCAALSLGCLVFGTYFAELFLVRLNRF